jgi:hypothetical protein
MLCRLARHAQCAWGGLRRLGRVTVGDGHMLGNFVEVDNSLESLAHEVALAVDGRFIESLRKAKSSSPEKSQ